ncbi:hypothetical protein HOM50_01535 [bacterium]|jgi:hypothetical protein|nr:hypothetical protein [bacterium]
MSYKFLLFTLILSPMVYGKQMSIPVVTIVPVANLATEPSSKRFPNDPNPYDKLGTTYKSGIDSCPRLHQLLFNEQVRIIEQNGNDVLIEVPYLYFQTSPKGHKINRYWTDKRYFRPLKAIPQSQSCIPKPIDFNQLTTDHNNITTLTKPFYHCPSNTTYSAGTRFITTKHTSRGDSVLIYDPTTKQTHKASIPAGFCIHPTEIPAQKQKEEFFVKLLKKWVHDSNGQIPYVWGGCSFNHPYASLNYSVQDHMYKDKLHSNYTLTGHYPACDSGFDCTGLILRAAQIAQLPYFFKNTTTVGFRVKPLKRNEPIASGDLILFPGHIIVISDVNKNLVIEARSKYDDYGYIHEVPLNKVFRGINTFDDLRQAYMSNLKLERLNAHDKTISQIPIRILKLNSIWR